MTLGWVFIPLLSSLSVASCGRSSTDGTEASVSFHGGGDRQEGQTNRNGESVTMSHEQAEQLESLGYVTSKKIQGGDLGKDGVTRHDFHGAFEGVNVYCSEDSETLKFLDMDGKTIHAIAMDIQDTDSFEERCKTAGFDAQGNLVVLFEVTALVKSNMEGDEQWRLEGRYHHDVDVMADGTVYALHRTLGNRFPFLDPRKTIIDNQIVKISPEGRVVSSISFAELLRESPTLRRKTQMNMVKPRFPSSSQASWLTQDVFHLNAIEVFREDVKQNGKTIFRKGQALVCSRYLDAIMVVDLEERQIVWHWGLGELEWPHHPSILDDGTMTVFDNGVGRRYSRVIQLDPVHGKILRSYRADPPGDFFSESRGSAQVLGNGNWLICESERGHVFEVDRQDNVVWEYWNFDRNAAGDERSTIFQFHRFPVERFPFLADLEPEGV